MWVSEESQTSGVLALATNSDCIRHGMESVLCRKSVGSGVEWFGSEGSHQTLHNIMAKPIVIAVKNYEH